MKKGFTLIELLAVIVILAIIAVIATPIVLNIINDTKESAILRSADFYIDALENEIMLENMKQGGNFNPNICTVTNKVITCDSKEIKLKVDGEVPTSGSITFEEGKVTDVNLTYPNGTVTLNNKGELVLGGSTATTVNTLKDLAVVSEELGVNSIDSCATGEICESGIAFAIKVNDNETYKFYVLNDDGNTVNLILNRNLYSDTDENFGQVDWIDMDDYRAAGGTCSLEGSTCNIYDFSSFGPITALKVLKERTGGWTNINTYRYDLNYGLFSLWDNTNQTMVKVDDEGVYTGKYVKDVRARLPKLSDLTVEQIGCSSEYCPEWLYENLDSNSIGFPYNYWLSDADSEQMDMALTVDCENGLGSDMFLYEHRAGIRPVITLTK